MPTLEITLPAATVVDTASDRTLHKSLKALPNYPEWGLPKAVFFKGSKISSKDFTRDNPLICKVKQRGRILAYGYQRANRAAEHGEKLIQKKFGIRQSLAIALKVRARTEGTTEVALVEGAIAQLLGVTL